MDTIYHIFTKLYSKNQITCFKKNLLFYKKYDIRTSYYSVCNTKDFKVIINIDTINII